MTAATSLADIIDTLIAARRDAGLSQRDVAARIGVTHSTLALWETGNPGRRKTPSADRLLDWANAVGVDLRPHTADSMRAVTTLAALERDTASGYLLDAVTLLAAEGITNPTVQQLLTRAAEIAAHHDTGGAP